MTGHVGTERTVVSRRISSPTYSQTQLVLKRQEQGQHAGNQTRQDKTQEVRTSKTEEKKTLYSPDHSGGGYVRGRG
jgi:hypothetical protein